MIYRLDYQPGWDVHFIRFDATIQTQIWKKIQQLKVLPSFRHLKRGLPYFVAQAGQYRICFEEEDDLRIIVFTGNHKQYEEWYSTHKKAT